MIAYFFEAVAIDFLTVMYCLYSRITTGGGGRLSCQEAVLSMCLLTLYSTS